MTLTDFLLARIAEDEASVEGFFQGADPDFYWGPDRIRAECTAKRRIVELHDREWPFINSICATCADWEAARGEPDGPDHSAYPCDTLRALALPFADHTRTIGGSGSHERHLGRRRTPNAWRYARHARLSPLGTQARRVEVLVLRLLWRAGWLRCVRRGLVTSC